MSLGLSARAPRQSGLKKPRPLRSVSLQEPLAARKDLDICKTQRQVCLESLEHDKDAKLNSDIIVCKEIAALSAQLISQPSNDNLHCESRFHRQNSSTSASSMSMSSSNLSRCTSTDSDFPTTPDYKLTSSKKAMTDHNSNNIDSVVVSDHLGMGSETKKCDELISSYSRCNSMDNTGWEKSIRCESQKAQYQHDSKGIEDASSTEAVAVATLMTGKGEELVLTGRSMKTILYASRVLLREMQAKIIKIEQLTDFESSQSPNKKPETTTKRSDVEPLRLIEAVKPDTEISAPVQHSTGIKYSKQKLLHLSHSPRSKEPPALWKIVAPYLSDVCLPAEQVEDYFDADFFQSPDGSLVVEDNRTRRDIRHD